MLVTPQKARLSSSLVLYCDESRAERLIFFYATGPVPKGKVHRGLKLHGYYRGRATVDRVLTTMHTSHFASPLSAKGRAHE
jgi:hypothetical protein